MAVLARHVAVQDDNGVTHSFGPDSEVPEWALPKITNPNLWVDGDVPFPEEEVPAESDLVAALKSENERLTAENIRLTEELEQLTAPPASSGGGPPPRAGRGSGEDKWRAYAAEKGVDVDAIEERNEIIAFLESQGIPVE